VRLKFIGSTSCDGGNEDERIPVSDLEGPGLEGVIYSDTQLRSGKREAVPRAELLIEVAGSGGGCRHLLLVDSSLLAKGRKVADKDRLRHGAK
jgi:hypothetical protein